MRYGHSPGEVHQPCPRPSVDLLWLSLGDPVSDSFLVHSGGGFGVHLRAHVERLEYPGKWQEGAQNLGRSVSNLESFRCAPLRSLK